MAKVTYTAQHDWVALRCKFANGQKADVLWSRNSGPGGTVKVEPFDSARAETFSNITREAFNKMSDTGPYKNLSEVCAIMKSVGETATSFDAYLEGLKTALGVSGERPRPKGADNAPAQTVASLKASRGGHIVAARFPSGESIELKINKSSVGLAMDPMITSKWDEIVKFVFGIKNSGIMEADAFAESILEAAKAADGIDGWIDGMRAAVAPAPRR